MKISIIIPVHNGAQTIARCVESLGDHDPSRLEVLLIENNSSDHSWAVCQTLAHTYPTVTCLQTTQIGVSAARNMGLRIATGQVIGFLDADDTVDAGMLDYVRDTFAKHADCDMLGVGFAKVYPDGRVKLYHPRKSRKLSFSQMIPHVFCDNHVSGYIWNKYWRAEALTGVMFREDLTHSEDTHFVINSLMHNPQKKVYIDTKVLYLYAQGENSATARLEAMFSEDGRLKLIEAMYGILAGFPLKGYHRMLAKRLIFAMASSQYLRFRKALFPNQRWVLIAEMKKNVLWYGITFFVAPMETVKCFLRLILSLVR